MTPPPTRGSVGALRRAHRGVSTPPAHAGISRHSARPTQKKGTLNGHIERVMQRVQASRDQQDKVFHGVKVSLSTPNDRDDTMNFSQHVHNVGCHPVPTDLINAAEHYRPHFVRVGQRLAGRAAS